jgi:hypothetical protein
MQIIQNNTDLKMMKLNKRELRGDEREIEMSPSLQEVLGLREEPREFVLKRSSY